MEYIAFAFSGINILPSMLLMIVIFYWLSMILGVFSVDVIDFDLDFDLDCSSNLYFDGGVKIIKFLNIGAVPIMIYGTILFLVLWVLSMLVYYTNISPQSFGGFLIFGQNIIIAVLLTKALTEPLTGFFAAMEDSSSVEIVGKDCVLKSTINAENIGQAEIMVDGYPIVINVKSVGDTILKGSAAVVVSKVEEKDLYIVKEKLLN
mgnify:FL=1